MAIAFSLAGRVEAAAIVHAGKIEKKDMAESGSSWSEYLLGGPKGLGPRSASARDGGRQREISEALKTDPGGTALIVQFLLNKQSLDPARFDHYHPKLVRPLSKFETSTSPTTTTGAQVLGPGSSTPQPTEAQTTRQPVTTDRGANDGQPVRADVPEPEPCCWHWDGGLGCLVAPSPD